jgi:1,3-beta-glucan synthase
MLIVAQIDHLSNLGVDVAHRIGYDDFNESVCNRGIVHDTLAALKVRDFHHHSSVI